MPQTLETLETLRSHGVRVAASRYVESVHDAVEFAACRPIALKVIARTPLPAVVAREDALVSSEEIQRAYSRLVDLSTRISSPRILAQRIVEGGPEIAVECGEDLMLGRTIEIRSHAVRVDRLAPVDTHEAEAMIEEFHRNGNVEIDASTARTLADLLVSVSAVFSDPAVDRVTLDPVRLHDGAYDVLGASIDRRREQRPWHGRPDRRKGKASP